jgi:hypothetical protein
MHHEHDTLKASIISIDYRGEDIDYRCEKGLRVGINTIQKGHNLFKNPKK